MGKLHRRRPTKVIKVNNNTISSNDERNEYVVTTNVKSEDFQGLHVSSVQSIGGTCTGSFATPDDTPCSSPTAEQDGTSIRSEESSLLEAWSDDEMEELSVDSDCQGLERLAKQKFQQRGQVMAKVIKDKPQAYRDMILTREVASRRRQIQIQILHSYKYKDSVILDDDEQQPSPTISIKSPNFLQRLYEELVFETHHSVEAAWMAICYCLAHFSCFMILDVIRRLLRSHIGLSEFVLHSLFVVIGLTLMYVNGFIWTWLGQDSYRIIKFDFHNRRILDKWDAQILAWFRQRPTFQNSLSIFGFYTLYLGVTFFYDQAWQSVERWIVMGYYWWEAQMTNSFEQMDNKDDFEAVCEIPVPVPVPVHNGWSLWNHFLLQFNPQDSMLVGLLYDILIVLLASLAMAIYGGNLFEE